MWFARAGWWWHQGSNLGPTPEQIACLAKVFPAVSLLAQKNSLLAFLREFPPKPLKSLRNKQALLGKTAYFAQNSLQNRCRTECSAEQFDFEIVEGRIVEAAFDAGLVTSDAGALLLGASDRARPTAVPMQNTSHARPHGTPSRRGLQPPFLMASRRLKSDRFFTDDYRSEIYTEFGMDWIRNNGLKSVLLRHLGHSTFWHASEAHAVKDAPTYGAKSRIVTHCNSGRARSCAKNGECWIERQSLLGRGARLIQ